MNRVFNLKKEKRISIISVKKKKLMKFIVLIFSCLSILNACAQSNNLSYIITNHNSSDKTINVGQISGLFSNMDALTAFIKSSYQDSLWADYQKAWRFMVDYTWSAPLPLTHHEWYHAPLLFINSAGWGLCDDKAIVLAQIWKNMGYTSRVCYLKGHVVPEIFINGHWEMWDPTFHVFYSDSNKNVLGVEDILTKQHHISSLHKDEKLELTLWSKLMGFSKSTKELYKYSKTSSCSESQNHTLRPIEQLLLPAQSRLIFPVKGYPPLKTTSYGKTHYQKKYMHMVLKIKAGWTGIIEYPLIFHAVKSKKASIGIDNRLIVFEKNHTFYVKDNFEPYTTINIIDNTKGVELYFLINPRLFQNISINGAIPGSLSAQNIEIKAFVTPLKQRAHFFYLDKSNPNGIKTYQNLWLYFMR